ncbi:MAG: hypothetical protein GXP18_05500 [Gammaproteobacteria bacterium]|nr:hypothetical protein [Gammaproteobacteria bacterium]
MKHQIYPGILIGGLVIALWAVSAGADDKEKNGTYISIKASEPVLIRQLMGPVVNSVNGVPAEPVDGFNWAGSAIRTTEGKARINVDPVANTGSINAEWEDEYGYWTFQQTMFMPPNHPTGARIGSSRDTITMVEGDPITTNVYLHGDTGAGAPLVPTVFNLLATWGPVKVTLNGEPFDNPFDGPAPMWIGHTMLSEGIRDANGAVRTTSGEVYDMTRGSEGQTYPDDLVFHLAFHDMPGPDMNTSVPPVWSFFYQVAFNNVQVKVRHKD